MFCSRGIKWNVVYLTTPTSLPQHKHMHTDSRILLCVVRGWRTFTLISLSCSLLLCSRCCGCSSSRYYRHCGRHAIMPMRYHKLSSNLCAELFLQDVCKMHAKSSLICTLTNKMERKSPGAFCVHWIWVNVD